MTQVVSIRVPSKKVAEIDRKAADIGLDRTNYILRLVNQDLQRPASKSKRRFASSHLLGRFRSKGSSNAQIRAALKIHLEKNR
jgi:hypothetical protein